MPGNSHTIEVVITSRCTHIGTSSARVSLDGDGDIDHFLDSFRAAMIAAGFGAATAGRLTLAEDAE